jgi:hypothetical protein
MIATTAAAVTAAAAAAATAAAFLIVQTSCHWHSVRLYTHPSLAGSYFLNSCSNLATVGVGINIIIWAQSACAVIGIGDPQACPPV